MNQKLETVTSLYQTLQTDYETLNLENKVDSVNL